MELTHKIVWITGASSGLGRAMALEFASQGAIVAISARRMDQLNPDYALGFVMRTVSAIKSGCLETEA